MWFWGRTDAQMLGELKLIADFYDFMLWLVRHTERSPRHHRDSVGTSMTNRLQTILAFPRRVEFARRRTPVWTRCRDGLAGPRASQMQNEEGRS